MPWRRITVEDLRKEFVEAAKSCSNFSSLCREFGITRATGYKWVNRYENNEDLSDRSKRPNVIPNKTPQAIENQILDVRTLHPGWGAKKIKYWLENRGVELPSVKTVNNILNRNGCISQEESLKHKPFVRFEKDHCNEMWQTDFKGEFKMQNGKYCFPLDIFDDHSRFVIRLKPTESTANFVLPTFREAFFEYGMPDSVLSDNGGQFAGFRQGYTQFEKWLMDHNVLPIHGRIKHPQTQGKIERFHKAMKEEVLKYHTFIDLADAERTLNDWRNCYNNERPHEALGMKCPSDVYVPSQRIYHDKVPKYEYNGNFHVIKVNSWGYVRFDKWQVYLSETMIDEHIEFRPNLNGDTFIACYRNFGIAEFDVHTGKLLHRKIWRL